ncbi:MAG: ATP-binding cassette domain-containing protein [Candidatus Lokiarchaeota archaeon]|nr:ATP-binding cassette domain-containing protein [Candidatus Lokiarchaeota archaeon]MBD3338812.1 ATP-binding cassette domain-containing protein [Candidatus Lokiarchaeota archaeon]
MEAIAVKSLSKYFTPSRRGKKKGRKGKSQGSNGIVKAVDGIDLHVKQGEIFGFLGPNGAGKTTTIRMLTGVLEPTQGVIKIFGVNVWKKPLPIKQITGNVPEMANNYPDLTGFENINFIGKLYGIPKKIRHDKADNLLKKFDLYEARNRKAKTYSKGMKQRLLLCMALINDPKLLFLDEPTSGLDVQSARMIKKVIMECREKGMTIFLTTHDMDVANELCDRIAIINKGKIVYLETPDNLRRIFQENFAIKLSFINGNVTLNLNELESIKEVNKKNGNYILIVNNINDCVCEITDFAKKHNIKINSLNTLEPSLGDVFLKIIEQDGV